jgi:hypothetical protein
MPVRVRIQRRTKVEESEIPTTDEDTQITDKRLQMQIDQLGKNEIKQQDVETASIGS